MFSKWFLWDRKENINYKLGEDIDIIYYWLGVNIRGCKVFLYVSKNIK